MYGPHDRHSGAGRGAMRCAVCDKRRGRIDRFRRLVPREGATRAAAPSVCRARDAYCNAAGRAGRGRAGAGPDDHGRCSAGRTGDPDVRRARGGRAVQVRRGGPVAAPARCRSGRRSAAGRLERAPGCLAVRSCRAPAAVNGRGRAARRHRCAGAPGTGGFPGTCRRRESSGPNPSPLIECPAGATRRKVRCRLDFPVAAVAGRCASRDGREVRCRLDFR